MPALEEAVKILDGRLGDGRSRLGFIVVLTGGEDTSGLSTWSESERRHETIRDVGVLYAGEGKHFVVHLNVPAVPPPPSSVECGCGLSVCDDKHHRSEHHLLAVGYSYSHSNQYHLGAPAITVEGHGVFIQRSPEIGGRRRRQALLPSPVVLQHIVRFELLEVVSGLIHGGELMIKDRARAGELLQLKWEEFRACHQFWGGLDMSGLEKEMDAMVSSLEAGAVAYVYAWVSSHQMQRATSLGSPEKAVAEFLTPAMRLMLEEAQRLPLQAQTTAAAAAAAANVEHTTVGCADCVHMQMIDRRLELWSKVKSDVKHLMFRPSSAAAAAAADGEEDEHLAAVFLEASLEAIDRAMHRDVYLAAVYASRQRRWHSGGGK